jgi:hypothetical protein
VRSSSCTTICFISPTILSAPFGSSLARRSAGLANRAADLGVTLETRPLTFHVRGGEYTVLPAHKRGAARERSRPNGRSARGALGPRRRGGRGRVRGRGRGRR